MRITLAQLDAVVGDVAGNARRILRAIEQARSDRADLLVTPELALIGYPPRDLLLREGVVEACEAGVDVIAAAARGLTVVVGAPRRVAGGVRGVRNSAFAVRDGTIIAIADKRLLPGYDVFDEDRYFDPGEETIAIEVAGKKAGLLVCEDLWRASDVNARSRYAADPVADAMALGCDVLISLHATHFVHGKLARHLDHARSIAASARVPIVAVNQVGANDDLVYDGRSFVLGRSGEPLALLPAWREAVTTIDLDRAKVVALPPIEPMRDLWEALVLGVRDYAGKVGAGGVVIGLSGGVDSALTAAIAAAALGPDRVRGVLLPSRYSSRGSVEDARALAANIGLRDVIETSIESAHCAVESALGPALGGAGGGVTDENIQARLRGLYLMAHANATGALLLLTSNKSELAMGYTTLYGDMAGALAVLGDLVKTRLYALARWANEHAASIGFERAPIPDASIAKPPSAELRPNQTDQDTLPPYDVLDEILVRIIEQEHSVERIVAETALDEELVRHVARTVDRFEYKRHQAAVILKLTERSFGRGRTMPVVMREAHAPARTEAAPGDTVRFGAPG